MTVEQVFCRNIRRSSLPSFVWDTSQARYADCLTRAVVLNGSPQTEFRSMFPCLYTDPYAIGPDAYMQGCLSRLVFVGFDEEIRQMFRACDVRCMYLCHSYPDSLTYGGRRWIPFPRGRKEIVCTGTRVVPLALSDRIAVRAISVVSVGGRSVPRG
jgi:hypothetical protein